MEIDKKKIIMAFAQIFSCSLAGALITWMYIGKWQMGFYYGSALGTAIYIASQTDSSPLIKEHMKRLE
jgi:hypothetical protein